MIMFTKGGVRMKTILNYAVAYIGISLGLMALCIISFGVMILTVEIMKYLGRLSGVTI